MRRRTVRSAAVTGLFVLLSACASHAPTVECDKRLAPINVGDTLRAPALHKDNASAGKPKS